MKKQPDVQRLIELQSLLLRFRSIERHSHIPDDLEKRENDVEHSYSLAMCAWFLASYFPNLDTNKVIKMALAHDLIEVHAGDTFVYGDKTALENKKEREDHAFRLLQKEWPDFDEALAAMADYEQRQSAEAKFVYALDKLLPPILNYLSEGYVWKKHGITFTKFLNEKTEKIVVSPEISDYYEQLVELLKDLPHFFPAEK